MKKIILLTSIIITYLFSYITATSVTNGINTLIYTNNGKIIINNNQIQKIKIKNFNEKLVNSFDVKDIASKEDQEFGEHHYVKIVKYKDILSFLILNDDEEVIIKKNKNEYNKKIKQYTDEINSPVFGKIEANCKSVSDITYCTYNNIPVYIETDDDEYTLKQIQNKNVEQYLKEKNTLKTHLDNFDFTKEPIYAQFSIQTPEETDYFKINFKTVNPQNGMFLVTIDGSGMLLYNDDSKIKMESYLIDLDTQLFQVGGQLFIDNEKNSIWKQDPNSIKAPLLYLDDKGNQRSIFIIRNSNPLYDFGGLLYFVSWCNIHNKSINNFRYIDKGAINGKIQKIQKNKYNIKVYTGKIDKLNLNVTLDNYSRIISIEDLKNNKKIKLIGEYTNNTIEKNKKYLKELFEKLQLKAIND